MDHLKDRLDYLGNPGQLFGVEEHRLVGGKGDGMRLYQVQNGLGLSATVSLDRCADLSRLSFKGVNLGFFSPCGYVSPAYYSKNGTDFLQSFTAGFLTTCGLAAVGNPCTDEGETLGLHGTISNTPCEQAAYQIGEDAITVTTQILDGALFARRLELKRIWRFSLTDNTITLTDAITNKGRQQSPVMVLYHMNMGYPLLDETAVLSIPSASVAPRNERAAQGLSGWQTILPPQDEFEEQCYYHTFDSQGETAVSIRNKKVGVGLEIAFDPAVLDCFTQWKLLEKGSYVMGLEPGNCLPDGRDVMRKTGRLKCLEPGETRVYTLKIKIWEE